MLVDRLAPPRSFDRPPLCQVAVVLHNASDENAPLIHGGGSVFDLTWFAREIEGRIEGSIEYRADLYDDATIDRIISHLETFLRAAVRDPASKLSQISLLTAAERQVLLTMFNDTTCDIDRASVTVQFERQAAARPDETGRHLRWRSAQLCRVEPARQSVCAASAAAWRGQRRPGRCGPGTLTGHGRRRF